MNNVKDLYLIIESNKGNTQLDGWINKKTGNLLQTICVYNFNTCHWLTISYKKRGGFVMEYEVNGRVKKTYEQGV